MTHSNPIMMSTPMVQACLRQVRGEPGGKTQTRRMPTKQWDALERRFLAGEKLALWVRETFAKTNHGKPVYRADATDQTGTRWTSFQPGDPNGEVIWTPSIHIPRRFSRLTLLDGTIRRERLGDISEADAIAEGAAYSETADLWRIEMGAGRWPIEADTAMAAYRTLWETLHGPHSWDRDADKEVMVIGFRPVLGNIDEVTE